MRLLLFGLWLWIAMPALSASRTLCWLDCEADLTLLLLSWQQRTPAGSFQLQPESPEQNRLWPTAPPSLGASLPLSMQEGGWKLKRLRPELRWRSEWGDTGVRFDGNRVRLRLDSADRLQRWQLTVDPDDIKFEFRLAY